MPAKLQASDSEVSCHSDDVFCVLPPIVLIFVLGVALKHLPGNVFVVFTPKTTVKIVASEARTFIQLDIQRHVSGI